MSEAKSYRARLTQSPEDRKNKELDYDIEESEDQLKADIRATSRAIAQQERKIDDLKNQRPLNVDALVIETGRLENLRSGLNILKKLKKELFPKTPEVATA